MRTASTAFKEKIKSSSRNFINTAVITLKSQVELTVTNANILFSGLEIEDSVGSDTTFNVLGSTIINKCSLTLYNGDESYSNYDFEGAHVAVYTALDIDNTIETIQLGTYTIDEANYTASSIVLSMLDNMSKFDISYSESQLIYPATLGDIVAEACLRCGVTFNSAGSDFVYDTFVVDNPPNSSVCTFRDVIGWVATINGTFANCNSAGQLEFKWFDTSNITNLPSIESLYAQDIAVSDITITGITVAVSDTETGAVTESSTGTDDYTITVKDNLFITLDNIDTVRDQIANKILGLSFRRCNVTCVSNPLLEAGDTALLTDTKGNEHLILITRVTFSPTANQKVVCGADTPSRNSATLYSSDTRTTAQLASAVNNVRGQVANVAAIANNTNQYFWFTGTGTDTGAHITEVPQDEFTDPNSQNYHTGYNSIFRSIGFAIRNGLTELATFGASAITLGLANAKHILIDTNGISLYSAANTLLSSFTANGTTFYDTDGVTTVAKIGAQIELGKPNNANLILSSDQLQLLNSSGSTVTQLLSTNTHDGHAYISVSYIPDGIRTVFYTSYEVSYLRDCYYEDTGEHIDFPTIDETDRTKLTFATPPETGKGRLVVSHATLNNVYRLTLGSRLSSSHAEYTGRGPQSISIGINNSVYGTESICIGTYNITYTNFGFAFGVYLRLGQAVTTGTSRSDTQVVLGKYNKRESQKDYSFIIGNGTSDSNRNNAFAITYDGSVAFGLDTTASSGTIDANLYNAITALEWEDDVII